MTEVLKVLCVDDEQAAVLLVQYELTRAGIDFIGHSVRTEPDLRGELTRFEPDIVLCDYTIPGFSGLRALDVVRELRPATPVLIISGSIAEDTAIECLARGATDYLLKSNLRRLGPAVRRAVDDSRQRRVLQEKIEQLAHFDALTGLPNLSHIPSLLAGAIERARANRTLAALVALNLNRFRFIDESLGRHHADAVLRAIAAVLEAGCREHDAVARVCADEFVLVLADVVDDLQAAVRVHELLSAIANPRRIEGRELQITASAGIAVYPDDGADFETLLSKASAAMHEAKQTGGLQFHSSDVVREAHQRRQLETSLRNAIEHNELVLHYQPQFEIRTGRLCGVEALARWYPRNGKVISPGEFIPIAEQAGLIDALGAWALRDGCKTAAEWTSGGSVVPTLCVNVSTQQICEEFTSVIAHALSSSGLPPERLELEITESVLLADAADALSCLAQWKRPGVRIAVDDFGTGYSSLSYLSRLPVDRLKMDRALIHGMTLQAKDTAIVRAVISLGRELGFAVLAEGVETEEQLEMLDSLGCQQAQGYLLTPPIPAAEARTLMWRRWGARGTVHMPTRRPAMTALAHLRPSTQRRSG
jgi:diguanylate cyclase (GGDEF)-like protein